MTKIDNNTQPAPISYADLPVINRGNIFSRDDNLGVGTGPMGQTNTLSPPMLTSKPDMMRVMAAFEDLIILLSELAKETQSAERAGELASLLGKITMLNAAAKEKAEGAQQMKTMAIVSLVIAVVSAGISIAGGIVSLKGAIQGVKAAKEVKNAAGAATDAASGAAGGAASGAAGSAAGAAGKGAKGSGAASSIKEQSMAFNLRSEKMLKRGGIMDATAKAVQAAASYTNTQGQVQSQMAVSRADTMQAEAEELGAEAQKSQNLQQDMRDLLAKMVELLNSFYQAQDKISSAASH